VIIFKPRSNAGLFYFLWFCNFEYISVDLVVAESIFSPVPFQSQNSKPTSSNAQTKRAIESFFIVFGGLIAIGGCIYLLYTTWFVAHASKAVGQVIKMETRMEASRNGYVNKYRPIYTFSDASGIVHIQACDWSLFNYSFRVGEKVTIIYSPASPEHSNIDSFMTVWFGPLFVLILGMLFGCLGFFLRIVNQVIRNLTPSAN
jgi:Protein of unknown function (DUF3592)